MAVRQLVPKVVTVGLASASFRRIASASPYDARASTFFPDMRSTSPMAASLHARLLEKSVTAGLASASFRWIARAASYDARASALPRRA